MVNKKQLVIAFSTTEDEYIAVTSCATQAVWLKRILKALNQKQKLTTIFCDNKSAIALCKNPMFYRRSKHIDIWFHKIREVVDEKEVLISYCLTEEQVAGNFTKLLKTKLFYNLKKMLRIINSMSLV